MGLELKAVYGDRPRQVQRIVTVDPSGWRQKSLRLCNLGKNDFCMAADPYGPVNSTLGSMQRSLSYRLTQIKMNYQRGNQSEV